MMSVLGSPHRPLYTLGCEPVSISFNYTTTAVCDRDHISSWTFHAGSCPGKQSIIELRFNLIDVSIGDDITVYDGPGTDSKQIWM